MSLDVYLRLQAGQQRRAQPRATRRHAHLSARPLVVTGYHLAGEPGAPVALRYGTAPERRHTLVVGEPRDRTLRYQALARFAADLERYLAGFTETTTVDGVTECVDAPQLVFPNATTAEWLTDILGRALRFLRPDGEYPVDPTLPVAGAHLTYLAGRRVLPGSAAVLAATDLLTTHWCTGQLPVEDEQLGTALAWVDPPDGTDGPAAALHAEDRPPAGPRSDPDWDRTVLTPLIGEYNGAATAAARTAAHAELVDACEEALAPAWRDTWATLELVRLLPEAAHVPGRWHDDRRAWTRHRERVTAGTAHFRRRMDQLRSFRFLFELERRTTALARQMALDDPLVLAARVADGDALTGELVDRDCTHRVTSRKGRAMVRPMLRLRPDVAFDRPVGTPLWWAADPRIRLEVADVDDAEVGLMVVAGATRSQAVAEQTLPEPGQRMGFVDSDDERFPDLLPEQLPWTHVPAGEADTQAGDE